MRAVALVYPFVFALYPALALFSHNLGHQRMSALPIPLLLSLAVAALVRAAVGLRARDPLLAAFRSFGVILCFFAAGHCRAFQDQAIEAFGMAVDLSTLGGSMFGLLAIAWLLVEPPKGMDRVTGVLAVFATLLAAMPVLTIAHGLGRSALRTTHQRGPTTASGPVSQRDPHIVYLILDGYGREDVLRDTFGYDNRGFLDALRARGFYVADRSHANYGQTCLSLASSLNMELLPQLLAEEEPNLDPDTESRQPLTRLIERNRTVALLRRRGYRFVAFESGYTLAEARTADIFASRTARRVDDPFIRGFLELTPFAALLDRAGLPNSSELHRQRVLYILDRLPEFVASAEPTFVFAHLLAPHPPFLFDAAGGKPEGTPGYFHIGDGDHFVGGAEKYRTGYVEQLRFVSERVLRLIDALLTRASRPLVIVVQGDHGPGLRLNHDDEGKTDLRERLAILNAYRFPDGDHSRLYPSITPVNSFRVVLSRLTGQPMALLPDEVSFSRWSSPYRFVPLELTVEGTLRVRHQATLAAPPASPMP